MLAVKNERIMRRRVGRSQVRFGLAAKCGDGKCRSTYRAIIAMSRASSRGRQSSSQGNLLMCPSHITCYRHSSHHCLEPQTDNLGSTNISSLPSNILGTACDYTHRRTTGRQVDRGRTRLVDREDQMPVRLRFRRLALVANSSCSRRPQMKRQIRHCRDMRSGRTESRFPFLQGRRRKCRCNIGRTKSIGEACAGLENDIGVTEQVSKGYGYII
jgi:hypothetical protein